jgi:hypothetical protein
MLLKASKSILTIFEQYFCENPSKLVSLADFATHKKKEHHFTTYFSKGNFRKKKKCPFWDPHHFDQIDLFFFWTDLDDIYGG